MPRSRTRCSTSGACLSLLPDRRTNSPRCAPRREAAKQPLRIRIALARPHRRAPPTQPFVVRLKAPTEGETTIDDQVQGAVTVQNAELDDFVLLRSDGTPTYMLAVVVDDHDMGVTHVIRGDDHLNNAFRQLPIIRAMGWPEPVYAHIPLIHGADGAKLSKRHGALGVEAYRDELGILPEALDNYLLRLGWGHGDDEIISREQAIEWFDLAGVGKSPVALRSQEAGEPQRPLYPRGRRRAAGRRWSPRGSASNTANRSATCCAAAMPALKPRAANLNELADGAAFLFAAARWRWTRPRRRC